MSALWRIEMLGGLCVQRGETTVTRFRTHKAAALLAYLALHPRRQHAREELADRFWPDADPEAARLSLRAALSALRRQFEDYGDDPLLVTHGNHSVSLNPALFTTDVADFEAAVKAKRGGEARRLYLGPLLPGFYEDWALQERERLEEIYVQACAEATDTAVSTPIAAALMPDAAPLRFLPPDLLCLFGRDEELNRLGDLLAEHRCVTLLGTGGIGKTRLALAAARRYVGRFEGGAAFVPLAEVTDARRILPAIRDALRLPPNAREEPLEQIANLLGERPFLLVLDNLEQVAAGGAGAVQMLLSRLPGLTCLVTSRRRLGISGERQFSVAPLMLEAGVRLFVDRAEAANPDFLLTERNRDDVMALVADLEGIPLAIELAAARASSLTPAEIRERLRERFVLLATRQRDKSERHRSLWAAMEWSYRLLTPEQRRLFARLSVFRGGWTTRAAETVCEEPSALEYLAQLRERSLIQSEETTGETRWRMLESLREFATEQLSPQEKEALTQRHATCFRDMAERLHPHLKAPDAAPRLDALECDHDNMRAAWEAGDAEIRLCLTASLWRFWQIRGHYEEGRSRLAVALSDAAPSSVRTLALLGAGTLAYDQGDLVAARELLETTIREASAEDATIAAKARNTLGLLDIRQGRFEEARKLFNESIVFFRAKGDEKNEASILMNLGLAYFREGRLEEARPYYEAAVEADRRQGEPRSLAFTLNNLGNLHAHEGRYVEARRCHEESLALKRELNDRAGIVSSLSNLGIVALRENHLAEALGLQQEALRLRVRLGLRHGIRESLVNLAALACVEKDYARALPLWGAAEHLAESLGVPVSPVEQTEKAETHAEALAALGQTIYEQGLAEGRALSLVEAVTLALGDA
jgi:predicted ATPase/Tfp pilus assembly protein PilF